MKKRCEMLLAADWLLPQDPERRVIERGAVAVAQGRVVACGPAAEVEAVWEAVHRYDLGRSLLLPGLVNAHTHSPMTLLRGVADDLPLLQWLQTRIWPLEAQLTEELIHLGSLLACAEMIATGTTCFMDMYMHQRITARAVEQSGMRAVLAEGILNFPTMSYKNPREAFTLVEELLEQFAGHPRIRFGVAPHTVYTTTPEQLRRSHALARHYRAVWFTHCAETATETAQCLEQHGKRPLELLDELGLLGPGSTLVHMVDLTDADIARVAASGAHVVLAPRSNMKLASGIARGRDLCAAGVRPGLGTDGAASNNALNMFQEMASCALLHKAGSLDATALPAQAVLDMATVNAAVCLRQEELGSLQPGHPADCIALDLDRPNLCPLHNPVSQLVYAASGHEVRFVMVGGRVLYQDGKFQTLDYPGLLAELASVRDWVTRHLGS